MTEKKKVEENKLEKKYDLAWDIYSEEDLEKLDLLNDKYIEFMSKCKTERECVDEFVVIAEKNGYTNIEKLIKEKKKVVKGDKVYYSFKNKALILFNIGEEKLENGMNILCSHVDSPRIDLKQNPLYEDSDLALFDTHYYGGIKKYQWVTTPLAIHGVVVKKDGSIVNVVVGEELTDPVIGVQDLLIHLAKDQQKKTMAEGVNGEDLNLLIGSKPIKDKEAKNRVKLNILNILNEKYGIDEEDFVSAEIEIVPAGPARHYGLDKSMVMAYGHDDRVCAYTSVEAMLNVEQVKKTAVTLLVDKEEIGSVGSTGMHGLFFENAVAELMNLTGDYSELKLRRALLNSKMLSSDVSAAFDPNYAGAYEKKNSAFLGKGIVFNKYTGARGKSGCNDANPEFIAEIRGIMAKHNVVWQTGELGKVDQGGGGTIAYIAAKYGMEVIDCGVPVLSMHAPNEVVSKADVYETMKGYEAFIKEA